AATKSERRVMSRSAWLSWMSAGDRERFGRRGEPLVQISLTDLLELVHMAIEEVIAVLDHVVVDRDAALLAQLVDELHDGLGGRDHVPLAMDDQARGGAGGEEAEIIHVGRQAGAEEPLDLGPAHQELH